MMKRIEGSHIVFATRNRHKIREFNQIFRNSLNLVDLPKIVGLEEIQCFEEIEETSDTIQGNAIQKARYVANKYHVNCFAEDTGLEIPSLNNAPGVRSARYAGDERDSLANTQLVLDKMVSVQDRRARFRTVIALNYNDNLTCFTGIAEGFITGERRGEKGFGYDPIFLPLGYDLTFAEMGDTEKNKISHRYKAIAKMVAFFQKLSEKK